MTNITIFTDAWEPQINGVVSTLKNTKKELERRGYDVTIIHPDLFRLKVPLQPSTGIWMPLSHVPTVYDEVKNAGHIHIATEGAIGLAARQACDKFQRKYTTSFHTQYPTYLYEHAGIPPRLTGMYFRWFHKHSSSVLVPTPAMVNYCEEYGIENLKIWSRGVDTNLFKPDPSFERRGSAIRAVFVGRVSLEKEYVLDSPQPSVLVHFPLAS